MTNDRLTAETNDSLQAFEKAGPRLTPLGVTNGDSASLSRVSQALAVLAYEVRTSNLIALEQLRISSKELSGIHGFGPDYAYLSKRLSSTVPDEEDSTSD